MLNTNESKTRGLRVLSLFVMFFLLTGCYPQLRGKSANEDIKPKKYDELVHPPKVETKLFLVEECPISGTPSLDDQRMVESAGLVATIIGIVGPTLVEIAVDTLGTSLKKASGQDNNTTTVEATTSDYFYQNVPIMSGGFATTQRNETKCLIFVKGKFGGKKTKDSSWYDSFKDESAIIEGAFFDNMKIHEKPEIYLEANMILPDGLKEYTITPRFLWYGKKLGSSFSKSRQLNFLFEMTRPSADPEQAGSIGYFNIEDMKPGYYLRSKELAGKSTSFLSAPAFDTLFSEKINYRATLATNYVSYKKQCSNLSQETEGMKLAEQITEAQCKGDTKKDDKVCAQEKNIRLLQLKKTKWEACDNAKQVGATIANIISVDNAVLQGGPFNLTARVTETRDINKWLLAIGEAIEQNKEDLSEEITNVVIPTKREEAEKLEKEKEITQQLAISIAESNVRKAQHEYDQVSGGDVTLAEEKLQALYRAKAELEKALLKLPVTTKN